MRGGLTDAIHIIEQSFGPVKIANRGSNSALMHAPHRTDSKPSFSLFLSRDGEHWLVHDLAQWEKPKRLTTFLREHGFNVGSGERKQRRFPRETEKSLYVKALETWANAAQELTKLPEEAIERFEPGYSGHGFGNLDVSKYGVYNDGGKPVIIYRDKDGNPVGIKVRTGNPMMKYTWHKPVDYTPPPFYAPAWNERAKDLLVVEGELKAVAMQLALEQAGEAERYQVVGAPSRSSIPRIPTLGFERVIVIFDDDVWSDLASDIQETRKLLNKRAWNKGHKMKVERLWEWMLLPILMGKSIRITSWGRVAKRLANAGYMAAPDGRVDANDILTNVKEPAILWRGVYGGSERLGTLRSPIFPLPLVRKHVPILNRSKLGLSMTAHHLATGMLMLALIIGKGAGPGNVRDVEVATVDLMGMLGVPSTSLQRARQELHRAGLVKHIRKGTPGDTGPTALPKYRVYVNRLLRYGVDDCCKDNDETKFFKKRLEDNSFFTTPFGGMSEHSPIATMDLSDKLGLPSDKVSYAKLGAVSIAERCGVGTRLASKIVGVSRRTIMKFRKLSWRGLRAIVARRMRIYMDNLMRFVRRIREKYGARYIGIDDWRWVDTATGEIVRPGRWGFYPA